MVLIAVQVAAAVFSFRGTRLNKAGNLRADLHLMKDLNAEMMVTQRASKKIQSHIRRLQEQYQAVKWSFYTTGRCMDRICAYTHADDAESHAFALLAALATYTQSDQWSDSLLQACHKQPLHSQTRS